MGVISCFSNDSPADWRCFVLDTADVLSGMDDMKTVFVRTPAKINLSLTVLGLRPDGYHEIETLFQAVDLFDEIVLEKTAGSISLHIPGHPDLETDKNIVIRAVRQLEKKTKRKLSVAISLNKGIPIAAGLGGGSSDGAAVLLGMRNLFGLDITDDDLWGTARSLGADVPFFLRGGTCIGRGIGDKLTPVELPMDYEVVLANPGYPVLTAEVFHRYSKGLTGHFREGRLTVLSATGLDLGDLLHNDLQAVCEAMHPEIKMIRRLMEAEGIRRVLMTGSGPTVFGIVNRNSDSGVLGRVTGRLAEESVVHWVVRPISGGARIN